MLEKQKTARKGGFLFEKKEAPGSLVNDIGLISVPVPGIVKGGFPLILGVVIIRGNLKTPSSFSR